MLPTAWQRRQGNRVADAKVSGLRSLPSKDTTSLRLVLPEFYKLEGFPPITVGNRGDIFAFTPVGLRLSSFGQTRNSASPSYMSTLPSTGRPDANK